MSILILGPESDVHVQAVRTQLSKMNARSRCGSLRSLLQTAEVTMRVGQGRLQCRMEPASHSFWGASESLDLSDISSIWLRRPGRAKAIDPPEPWVGKLIECETNRALQGIFRTLPVLWVNSPAAQDEAAFKVKQLEMAKACGLPVPETLITNSPAAVAEFYERCGGKMIYKLIDELSWEYFPDFEVPKGIPTLPFRGSDLEHVQQVSAGFHLFQERIEKRSDIRVTVVGHEIFAVRIDLLSGKSQLDFRLDYSVPMAVHHLPDEVAAQCRLLVRSLGLNFGAIDLCEGTDGRYVFLEVNAAGQWLWMEQSLGLPIASTVAALLAGVAQPLVSGTSKQ